MLRYGPRNHFGEVLCQMAYSALRSSASFGPHMQTLGMVRSTDLQRRRRKCHAVVATAADNTGNGR